MLVGCEAPIENAPSGFASWATGVAAAARASRHLVTPLAATGVAVAAGATAAGVVGAGAPAPLVSAAELIRLA